MVGKELIEQKIGEAIGLEIAAQKSVDELISKGLLKAEHEKKLTPMKEEANTQQKEMEELIEEIAEEEGFNIENINSVSEETAQKAYLEAVPVIDRMVTKGIIHKNKAARHKSRLSDHIKEMAA